jgi:hypothetical protein
MGWVLGKSVKNYGFFFIPILTYLKGEHFFSPFCDFLFVGSRKLISKREDMKIIKKCLFYFGLTIFLPIQIQLLDIEDPKNPKIDSPLICTLS